MKKQSTLFFLLSYLGIVLISCGGGSTPSRVSEENAVDSSDLVEATAPDAIGNKEHGYIFPGMKHGLLQSPINIQTKDLDSGMHKIMVHYQTSKEKVAFNGHTVQVDYDPGSTIEFDGRVYAFKQFHFHTPSEHLIDGITYPMEMHMVHIQEGEENEKEPHYLVVSMLFKEGEENAFLNEFIHAIPEEVSTVVDSSQMVDINVLLEGHLTNCLHYQGSLTTPPFTETVNWTILKDIFEASAEQIEKFNKLEGNNARHVQAIFDRKVDVQ